MSLADRDPFFGDDPDVLKTYAFDYEKIIAFRRKTLIWPEAPFFICCPWLICTAYLCEVPNVEDEVRAQHLAITKDGIRYVVDKHPTGCRLKICDEGKISKTVPFDKLTDCDNQEPAGAETICCIDRVLHETTVDTASGNRDSGGHELSLQGLVDPEGFKRDVWAMKRGDGLEGVPDSIVPVSMTRVEGKGKASSSYMANIFGGGQGGSDSEALPLLREHNQLLKQAVGYLKIIAEKSG